MKVRYRREDVTTIVPGGHYNDEPRLAFEVEAFCCDEMHAAWEASIIAMNDTPAVALAGVTVDRKANPRVVRCSGTYYPMRFCPFCAQPIHVQRETAGT